MKKYDRIIIGAGLYGLYAALFCGKRGERVLVLECDSAPFRRATYINQARVHQGYHYPRSLSTAEKSAGYFDRFNRDFGFCIHREFSQIYATSSRYSWTDGRQFEAFCRAAGIPCRRVVPENYFREEQCDGAFLTREYTYDAAILRDWFLEQLSALDRVTVSCGEKITAIEQSGGAWQVRTEREEAYRAEYLLSAAYAGTNQILKLAGFEAFRIKYELCEIILCEVGEKLKGYGFTVMDGPFFSIMPFGRTGLHSLTSVTFTPHMTGTEEVPGFACQARSQGECSRMRLGNCNDCPARPETAFPYMAHLARKYLRDEYGFTYHSSLFSMKPVLQSSEIDDSRPTLIRVFSRNPTFAAVLSGKINTVYDLDEVLTDG